MGKQKPDFHKILQTVLQEKVCEMLWENCDGFNRLPGQPLTAESVRVESFCKRVVEYFTRKGLAPEEGA